MTSMGTTAYVVPHFLAGNPNLIRHESKPYGVFLGDYQTYNLVVYW
jgi:hypothetical protein